MWFMTYSVCIFLLILHVALATNQNCLCVTGSTKKIYTSPEVTREEIGLAIRGECLPVAHTNDENESWVAVDFKKNIIFHQFHLIGYIMRDSGTVHRRCTGGQGIAFLTTTESYITYSPTTEVTTAEETLTTDLSHSNDSTTVTMATIPISTLKPTSDVTSGELMTTLTSTITDGLNNKSTTKSVTMPPTEEPFTSPPTKEPITMLPTKEPETMPPTKEPFTLPPTKEPITMPPPKEPFTLPPTKETVTTNETTSDITLTTGSLPATSTMIPSINVMSTFMTHVTNDMSLPINRTSIEPITNEISSTSLHKTQSTTPKQNLPITKPDLTTKATDILLTSEVTKGTDVNKNTDAPSTALSSISKTTDLTTVALPPSTVIPVTNTTDRSCDLVCLNGGACVTDPFMTCLCNGGWTGASCDVCAGTTCDQGSCVMLGATPRCVCNPGYTGVSCNESHVCNASDISIGGKCYTFNYVYEICQENYCMNQPGTECLVNSEGIYCLCQDEFNPQDSSPCGCPSGHVRHLNGTCVEIDCRGVSSCSHGSCYFRSFYNFGCLCDEGWEGEDCDMAVTQCGANRCNNNGTCVHDPDAMCHCADAWTGAECDMCGQYPCHHGVCILDRYQQPMCVCNKEYSGPKCDKVVQCSGQEFGGHCYGNDLENFTPCVDNVCRAGQLCVAALHTFKNDLYCVCKENVTEAYLTSDCGCPERSLRNYRGECIDILL